MASRCDAAEASRAACARGARRARTDIRSRQHRQRRDSLRTRRISSRPPGLLHRRCAAPRIHAGASSRFHCTARPCAMHWCRRIGSIRSLCSTRRRPHASSARSRRSWWRPKRRAPCCSVSPIRRSHSSPRRSPRKGYCLAADGGLDFAHPDIAHDLAHPDAPRTLIGYLCERPRAPSRAAPAAAERRELRQPVGQRAAPAARSRGVRTPTRSRPGALDRSRSPFPAHDGRQHHARDGRHFARTRRGASRRHRRVAGAARGFLAMGHRGLHARRAAGLVGDRRNDQPTMSRDSNARSCGC